MLADKAENLRRVLASQGIEWENEDLFGLEAEPPKKKSEKRSIGQIIRGWGSRKGGWQGFSNWIMSCLNARRGM